MVYKNLFLCIYKGNVMHGLSSHFIKYNYLVPGRTHFCLQNSFKLLIQGSLSSHHCCTELLFLALVVVSF